MAEVQAGDTAAVATAASLPGNHASAAQTQVFDLPELVERILSFLPILDLPAASKVDRRWSGVVNLERFQQVMFIKPVSKTLVYWHAKAGNPKVGVWSTSETEIILTKFILNPLVNSMPQFFDPTHHESPSIRERTLGVPKEVKPLPMTQPPMA